MLDLDAHIGVHADALRIRSQRAELIANNLANADTPGFKARDLDFRAALAASGYGDASSGLAMSTTQGRHLGGPAGAGGADAAQKYRQPLAPSRWTAIRSTCRWSRPLSPRTPCATRRRLPSSTPGFAA